MSVVEADQLLHALRGILLVIKPDGEITSAWGRTEAMIGRTIESLVGSNAIDLVCEHHLDILLEVFAPRPESERQTQIQRPVPFALDLRAADGKPLAVDVYATATESGDWAAQLLPRDINPNALDLVDLILDGAEGDTIAHALVDRLTSEDVGLDHRYCVRLVMNPGTPHVAMIGSGEDAVLDDILERLVNSSTESPFATATRGSTDMIAVDAFGREAAIAMRAAGYEMCSLSTETDGDTQRWCLSAFMESTFTGAISSQISQTRAPLRRVMRAHLERRRAERILEEAATSDPLTGLANRTVFDRELEASAGEAETVVMYIDVDHFKTINDRHGHLVGDAALVEIARRIRSVIRPGAVVARLGGDEFGVILSGVSESDARTAATRILESMARPATTTAGAVNIGVTIGVASSRNFEQDELLDAADRALFDGKTAGRGRLASAQPAETEPGG